MVLDSFQPMLMKVTRGNTSVDSLQSVLIWYYLSVGLKVGEAITRRKETFFNYSQ